MNDKKNVAIKAASLVEHDMVVGLGTGSTANYFIEELARRQKEEGLKIVTVASSIVSSRIAQGQGLEVIAIENVTSLDLYVDGADEVTDDMTLLKGRGSDLVREKLLAKASQQFYVLVDNSKLVNRIGEKFPIPIEVMPFAWQLVLQSVEQIGGEGDLRPNASGDGLAVTSHGSLVLDMSFDDDIDGHMLNHQLNAIPGVVEHGIFANLATSIFIGANGQIDQRKKLAD
ncbi:ribose 5-phosphate isomerase A [Methylophaga sp. 42_25_T18]|nr:ribose 5-phosphate isomerase A [Methylophaga sp. 42_25_T18]OUR87670.1 ribose 5-phosphate isomerase A [Methylophaga sp. 42_8_T64]